VGELKNPDLLLSYNYLTRYFFNAGKTFYNEQGCIPLFLGIHASNKTDATVGTLYVNRSTGGAFILLKTLPYKLTQGLIKNQWHFCHPFPTPFRRFF
jgi:hypothetical protein